MDEILAQRFTLYGFDPNALKYLYLEGADVNYESTNNTEGLQTPLEAALLRNNVETMQWLVDKGANINHINAGVKMTALEFAVVLGREKLVDWLLTHGARMQENKTGRPLLVAALNSQNPDAMFSRLLRAGADPYFLHEQNQSAIDLMAKRTDITRLRQFDKKGVYHSLVVDFTPSKNSPFIGTWANKGGWGTGIELKSDGTGTFLMGGVGAMPLIWREHGDGAELYDKVTQKQNKPNSLSTTQSPSCIQISFIDGKQKIRIGTNDQATFDKVVQKNP